MNVDGEEDGTGVLNIAADNEGLDTELHLTINGGNINITSGNDGINTNEDGISVTTINGGVVNIVVDGSTGEGDGIDSNGWLLINGGTVISAACSFSQDAGIDSDKGIYINGGTVFTTGNMLDEIADSKQNYVVFTFASRQTAGSVITLQNEEGVVVGEWTQANDFSILIFSSEKLESGTYTLWKDGTQLSVQESRNGMRGVKGSMMGGQRPEMAEGEKTKMPQDGERPEMAEGEKPKMPQDGERPEISRKTNGEAVTEFTIVDGGNMFMVIE